MKFETKYQIGDQVGIKYRNEKDALISSIESIHIDCKNGVVDVWYTMTSTEVVPGEFDEPTEIGIRVHEKDILGKVKIEFVK